MGQASRPDEIPGFRFCCTAELLGTMWPRFLCVTEGRSREPEPTMPCFTFGAAWGMQVIVDRLTCPRISYPLSLSLSHKYTIDVCDGMPIWKSNYDLIFSAIQVPVNEELLSELK